MEDLRIVDREFLSVYDTYAKKAEEIDQVIKEYLAILKSIVEEEDIMGSTADALRAFTDIIEKALGTRLTAIMSDHKIATKRFMEEVISQDDILF